jgi:hypothetical protein
MTVTRLDVEVRARAASYTKLPRLNVPVKGMWKTLGMAAQLSSLRHGVSDGMEGRA